MSRAEGQPMVVKIVDVTELKAIVVCEQRAYEVPKQVADEIESLRAQLAACLEDAKQAGTVQVPKIKSISSGFKHDGQRDAEGQLISTPTLELSFLDNDWTARDTCQAMLAAAQEGKP